MEKVRKNKKVRIKKGRVILLLLFIMWTIYSGIFLTKVIEPTVKLWELSDNYQFSDDYGNPYDSTGKDEAYKKYNDYANSLINGDDDKLASYVQLPGYVKLTFIIIASIPFIMIISFIISAYDKENARKKSKHIKYHTSRQFKKHADLK